jgi:hypothetical protein
MDALADDASDEEQQRALAAALRRQQSLGLLGQLSGDPVLSNVGQSLLGAAQHGMQQQESARERRLQLRIEQRRATAAERHNQIMEERLGLEDWSMPFKTNLGLAIRNKRDGRTMLLNASGSEPPQPDASPDAPSPDGAPHPCRIRAILHLPSLGRRCRMAPTQNVMRSSLD